MQNRLKLGLFLSFRVQWFGNMPVGAVQDPDQSFEDRTIDASDAVTYRHFAVDDANKVVYYCDRNPRMDNDMACYSHRKEAGINVWQGNVNALIYLGNVV